MEREKELTVVTLVGSIGNLVLLAFKFVAGILGHSAAMVADAVHSLSDFVTDVIVLVFVRIGSKPQDASHDYGHGKFETLATLFVAMGLVLAALGIIASGALKFIHWLQGETLEMPGKLALWAALLSIVVKEILFRYTLRAGKKHNSPAVVANAWHHRSDALSSIGAAIGIGGACCWEKNGPSWTRWPPFWWAPCCSGCPGTFSKPAPANSRTVRSRKRPKRRSKRSSAARSKSTNPTTCAPAGLATV